MSSVLLSRAFSLISSDNATQELNVIYIVALSNKILNWTPVSSDREDKAITRLFLCASVKDNFFDLFWQSDPKTQWNFPCRFVKSWPLYPLTKRQGDQGQFRPWQEHRGHICWSPCAFDKELELHVSFALSPCCLDSTPHSSIIEKHRTNKFNKI